MRFVDIRHHPAGAEIAWQLLNERPMQANISHRESEMPTFDEHKTFVANHPYRMWLVIETEQVVGTIYLTMRNEVGIAILREQHRKGYARQAIQRIVDEYPPLPLERGVRQRGYVANVAIHNEPSMLLFANLGADPISVTCKLKEK